MSDINNDNSNDNGDHGVDGMPSPPAQQQQQQEQVENHNNNNNNNQETTMMPNNNKIKNDDDDETTSLSLPAELALQHNITVNDVATAVRVLNAVAALHCSSSSSSNISNSNNKKKNGQKRKRSSTEEDDEETEPKDGTTSTASAATASSSTTTTSSALQNYRHCQALRPFRKALAQCFQVHQQTLYNGKSPQELAQEKLHQMTLKRQKMAESQQQRQHIANTLLRKGRMEKLQQKQAQEGMQEEQDKYQQAIMNMQRQKQLTMMIPDGHVETLMLPQEEEEEECAETETDQQQREEGTKIAAAASTAAPSHHQHQQQQQQQSPPTVQLPKLRSCYVCKARFRQLHHFYDQLCPECAALNWQKRHQTGNLQGKTALVTGARVKIGYQTCLKLLRAGCTVIATTRFPNAAAATYRQEPDFAKWQHRLQIFGLDLRDVTGLEAFCRFLQQKLSQVGLDILINNACQTIRRPRAYYLPACDKEQALWQQADQTHQQLLAGCREFESIRRRLWLEHHKEAGNGGGGGGMMSDSTSATASLLPSGAAVSSENEILLPPQEEATITKAVSQDNDSKLVAKSLTTSAPFETTGLTHSAAASQMILVPEDVGVSESVLPKGATDINGQQLDLRTTNSWLLKMDEVSTPEVMECMFINAIAPFVLNSRLKPLMCTRNSSSTTAAADDCSNDNDDEDRYIINVSAMEGKFYRYKMANHPHTNMAKSALNMMTRTAAEDLAQQHRIYMNSIDTGWINDENPLERASATAKNNHFQTPIDEIDAAARILDPIFSKSQDYGKFLKDYRETEW
jgi:NAD(P)-dependent dehydrogenase (short-subunit alcohol dehydrogenase family)